MSYALHTSSVFMQRMETDHSKIRHMLQQLSLEVTQLAESGARNASAVAQNLENLLRLREFLVEHFREEEEGGCLEEAACHCPSISHEVSRLQHQHKDILFLLDKFIDRQRYSPRQMELSDFREIDTTLQQHEECEERAVRHGFNIAETL